MNHTKIDFGFDMTAPSKFNGAVLGPDNKIYCIPSNSDHVLIVDPVTDTAEKFFHAEDSDVILTQNRYQQWSGGALCDSGKIYCAPAYSTYVLVIDTNDLSASYTIPLSIDELDDGSGGTFAVQWERSHKFEGATKGPDGLIYFSPLHSPFVCVLDPSDDSYEMYPSDQDLSPLSKFSDIINMDTELLLVPLNFDNIVKIPYDYNTNVDLENLQPSDFSLNIFEREYAINNRQTEVIDHITIEKIPYNTLRKNRWTGGVRSGSDVYAIPYVSTFVMKIQQNDIKYITVSDSDETSNKWWGGAMGSDNKIYCAPYGSNYILSIDTLDDSVELHNLNGYTGTQKWKTAIAYGDSVYFIPYMADGFLKIDTGSSE